MSSEGNISRAEKEAMVGAIISVHGELQAELTKGDVDPARMLKLIGAGVNQTLLGLAVILSDG